MAKNLNDDVFIGKQNHKRDHKKRHKPGFNEGQDVQLQRAARINFKNYMREMEEQEALELLDDDFDDMN